MQWYNTDSCVEKLMWKLMSDDQTWSLLYVVCVPGSSVRGLGSYHHFRHFFAAVKWWLFVCVLFLDRHSAVCTPVQSWGMLQLLTDPQTVVVTRPGPRHYVVWGPPAARRASCGPISRHQTIPQPQSVSICLPWTGTKYVWCSCSLCDNISPTTFLTPKC